MGRWAGNDVCPKKDQSKPAGLAKSVASRGRMAMRSTGREPLQKRGTKRPHGSYFVLDDGVYGSDTITDRVNSSEYESCGEDMPAGKPNLEAPAPSEATAQGSGCENNALAGRSWSLRTGRTVGR